jgi:hypothetical protein
MSVKPLEPVLVFSSDAEARAFQSNFRQGRIMSNHRSSWVFLPMPDGLVRLRTSRNGDIAYDFESHRQARAFDDSIGGQGRIYPSTRDKPVWDRTVYVGRQIRS